MQRMVGKQRDQNQDLGEFSPAEVQGAVTGSLDIVRLWRPVAKVLAPGVVSRGKRLGA